MSAQEQPLGPATSRHGDDQSVRLRQTVVRLVHPDPWAYAQVGATLDGPMFLWHEPGAHTLLACGLAAAAPDLSADAPPCRSFESER